MRASNRDSAATEQRLYHFRHTNDERIPTPEIGKGKVHQSPSSGVQTSHDTFNRRVGDDAPAVSWASIMLSPSFDCCGGTRVPGSVVSFVFFVFPFFPAGAASGKGVLLPSRPAPRTSSPRRALERSARSSSRRKRRDQDYSIWRPAAAKAPGPSPSLAVCSAEGA